MRLVVQETASWCSEKLLQRGGGKISQHMCDFGEEGVQFKHIFFAGFASFTKVTASHKEQTSPRRILVHFLDMKRYKNWAHKISSWKYLIIWRPVLPVFPRAQSASFLFSTLNSFQGVLKVSSCSSTWFNPCRGRWQVPLASANL